MTSDRELGDRLRRAFEEETPPRITAPQVRERAEQQMADIADLVLFLVGAYANKILPQLLPHLPYTPPAGDVSKLAIVQDTLMGWATETLERAGMPQLQRPADKAAPVFDFERLIELGRQDAKVRAGLGNAMLMVEEAARQLASISPDDPTAQKQASQALTRAISLLLEASARLMQLDAVQAAATEPVEDPRAVSRDIFATTLDEAARDLEAEASPEARIGPVAATTRAALYGPAPIDDNRSELNAEGTAAWTRLEGLLADVHR